LPEETMTHRNTEGPLRVSLSVEVTDFRSGPFRQILRRKQMSAFRVTGDVPRKVQIRRS
jgi:hypothetical protein